MGTNLAELRKDFWTLYDEFMGALPHQDLGVIDRILDEGWVYTDFVGTVRGKRDYFELVRQIVHDDSVARLVELDVRPCAGGEVVLATGRYEVSTSDTAGGTLQFHLRPSCCYKVAQFNSLSRGGAPANLREALVGPFKRV